MTAREAGQKVRLKSGRERPLIIHTESSRGWGGQEIRELAEMTGLRDRGYGVLLAAPGRGSLARRAAASGIAVSKIEFRSKIDPASWLGLLRLFVRLRPDAVNTHSSDDSWLAGPLARLCGVPLVIRTRHVSTPIGSAFSYQRFPHLILTTSEAIRRDLLAAGIERPIFSVPTGIDLRRFSFDPLKRRVVRDRLGVAPEELLVGNVCVLRSWKGLDFFLAAAAAAPAGMRFVLVGEGPQEKALMEKAAGLGLDRGRLIFAGHQEEVEAYLSAMDVFFFTSYASEGVPQGLVQAVAAGLPVVVCRLPSVLEALAGVEGVWQVDYGDAAAAGEAIAAAGRQGRQDGRTERNRQVISARYGLEVMLDALEEIYGRFLAGRGGAGA